MSCKLNPNYKLDSFMKIEDTCPTFFRLSRTFFKDNLQVTFRHTSLITIISEKVGDNHKRRKTKLLYEIWESFLVIKEIQCHWHQPRRDPLRRRLHSICFKVNLLSQASKGARKSGRKATRYINPVRFRCKDLSKSLL